MRARLAVEVGLLLAVLVGVNLLGTRHYWRGDFTRTHLYALSAPSRARLAALDIDVEIFAFVLRGAPGASELRGDLDELFERARRESSHLHVRFVDADREPAERRLWAARFRVNDDQLADGVVVVAHGDQWKVLERSDLAQLDERDGERQHLRGWRGEAALVDAIAAVTSGRAPEVCVATSHGEPIWNGNGNGTDGDETGFIDTLRRHQLAPRAVEMHSDTDPRPARRSSSARRTPPGRPRKRQPWPVISTAAGGCWRSSAPASTPRAPASSTPVSSRSFGATASSWGRASSSMCCTWAAICAFRRRRRRRHTLQRALDGKRLLFDGARPVRATAGHAAVELLRSSPASWGERDLLEPGRPRCRARRHRRARAAAAGGCRRRAQRAPGRVGLLGDCRRRPAHGQSTAAHGVDRLAARPPARCRPAGPQRRRDAASSSTTSAVGCCCC